MPGEGAEFTYACISPLLLVSSSGCHDHLTCSFGATAIESVVHQVLAREHLMDVLALRVFRQAFCVAAQFSHLFCRQDRFQRPAERCAMKRFLPAAARPAEVGAATGKLAGWVDLHALLRRTHDAD